MNFDLIKFQSILYDMLSIFDTYCKDHNLRYSLCAGSLLGAVRHHSIIPWDDDIDVMMPRPDYNRLLELSSCSFPLGFSIVYAGNTPNYYLPMAKMVNLNTTLVEFEHNIECPLGVNIDIFPIDVIDEDEKKQNDDYIKFLKLSAKASDTAISVKFKSPFLNGKFRPRTLLHYLKCHMYKNLYKSSTLFYEADEIASHLSWSKGKKCRIFSSYQYHDRIFDKKVFEDYITLDFGDLKISCIRNYNVYLEKLFKNYMNLPPKEKQVCHHHHFFLDMERGYTVKELKSKMKI